VGIAEDADVADEEYDAEGTQPGCDWSCRPAVYRRKAALPFVSGKFFGCAALISVSAGLRWCGQQRDMIFELRFHSPPIAVSLMCDPAIPEGVP